MSGKLAVGILAILVAATAWAGEPWKKKPYPQWDEKDIREALNASPWVRGIMVDAPWLQVSASEKKTSPSSSSPPSRAALPDPEELRASLGEPGSQVPVVILWASSRTIRAALALSAVLHGTALESDVDSYVAEQPPEYQIVVQGPDLTPFAQANEGELRQNAFLLRKSSKTKLTPSQVKIQHAGSSKQVSSVVFFFPKEIAGGELTIGPDEKVVEFRCEAGGTVFQTHFELGRMADVHGRDL